MQVHINTFRGEAHNIHWNIGTIEKYNAISKIIADIGIFETDNEINHLFSCCRNLSNHDQVEYVMKHITARNSPKSDVLSVFTPIWRNWLIDSLWHNNPTYAVNADSAHRYDFYEEIETLVDTLHQRKKLFPPELKPEDWRLLLVKTSKQTND